MNMDEPGSETPLFGKLKDVCELMLYRTLLRASTSSHQEFYLR